MSISISSPVYENPPEPLSTSKADLTKKVHLNQKSDMRFWHGSGSPQQQCSIHFTSRPNKRRTLAHSATLSWSGHRDLRPYHQPYQRTTDEDNQPHCR